MRFATQAIATKIEAIPITEGVAFPLTAAA